MEHRRHHVRVGDAVLLDEARASSSASQSLHQHDADAAVQRRRQRERQRRGVVQRAGARGARSPGVVAGDALRRRRAAVGSAVGTRPSAGRSCPTCRASCRRAPGRRCSSRRRRRARRPTGRSRRVAAGRRAAWSSARGAARPTVGGDVGQLGVGDDGLGLAVVGDVGRLVGGEVPVDRGEPQPAPVGGREVVGELGPVAAEQRHAVALGQALAVEQPGQAVGSALSSANVRSPCGRLRRDGVAPLVGPERERHARRSPRSCHPSGQATHPPSAARAGRCRPSHSGRFRPSVSGSQRSHRRATVTGSRSRRRRRTSCARPRQIDERHRVGLAPGHHGLPGFGITLTA